MAQQTPRSSKHSPGIAGVTRRELFDILGVAGAAAMLAGVAGCATKWETAADSRNTTPLAPGGHAVSFDFGCAKHLYEHGRHPRMLLSEVDVESLKRRCADGWCKELLSRIRQRVTPMIAAVLSGEAMPTAPLSDESGSARLSPPASQPATTAPASRRALVNPRFALAADALDDIAFIGVMDDNAEAIEATRRFLVVAPPAGTNGTTALAFDLVQRRLAEADRLAYCERAAGHIKHYLDGYGKTFLLGAGANIGATHMLGALMCWLAITGDAEAPCLDEEGKTLLRDYQASLYATLGEHGYPNEDMGYGTMMGGRLVRAASVLRRAGIYDAYERCPRLREFGRAILHFVQPWGEFLTNTGDHSDDFRDRELALAHLARHNNDPTLIWLLGTLVYPNLDAEQRAARPLEPLRCTEIAPGFVVATESASLISLPDAPRPMHPRRAGVPTSFVDHDRGIVSFRSGWRDDDSYIYFDGSQRPGGALGHSHDSGGHFALSALGEYFAVSPGRYGIEQDQHNLMLIDGKSGRDTKGSWGASNHQARLITCQPGALCDYAACDNTSQSNCFWSFRHIGLVKDAGLPAREAPNAGYVWTVDDVNAGNDYREYWWTLNSEPGNTIELQGDRAMVIGRRHKHRMLVRFALPATVAPAKPYTLELAQDVAITSSYNYVDRRMSESQRFHGVHFATYFRPRLTARIKGVNGYAMTALVPSRSDAPEPVIETLPTHLGALAIRVKSAAFHDTIIWGGTHRLLEADGVIARGQWIVARRDARGEKLLAHEIHHGDYLEIDGKRIRL